MPAIISKAPGKTILFGEHAVVYGCPAIAVPIEAVQVKVTILPVIKGSQSIIKIRNFQRFEDIPFADLEKNNPIRVPIENIFSQIGGKPPLFEMTISSTIPIAAGLGSSAALAVAITKGVSQFLGIQLSLDKINSLALQSEIIQHGSPSGIDNSVIAIGKPIYFLKNSPIVIIEIPNSLNLILGDTGKRTLTRNVVQEVRHFLDTEPTIVQPILEKIGKITDNGLNALRSGNLEEVGELMTQNHKALKELKVSSPDLDRLVDSAMKNGALGAKLCGGGKGGYMVTLCESNTLEKISVGLKSAGAENLIQTSINASLSKE
ncbi:MAG: mevalonate kinase [Pelolinea sp.]|nr:mevalonate kinase [Pelolinea sp.]